jgi:hypothetical protein
MHEPRRPRYIAPLDSIAERVGRDLERPPNAAGYVESHDELTRRIRVQARAADLRNSVEPTSEAIQRRIRTTAMVPSALTIACEEHQAGAGAFCFTAARGVCAERIKARAALR